jgi:hypothetical protein
MIVPSKSHFDVFVVKDTPPSRPTKDHESSKTGLKTRSCPFHARPAAWCCFCSCSGMETHRWLRMVALSLLLLLPAAHARAQAAGFQRVRTDSRYLRLVVSSGIERSPTFRRIIDGLEQSDVIVEVQCGHFVGSQRAGRTVLLSAQPNVRYVLVEVACWATAGPSLHMIGHELRHALEIAEATWVVDGPTLSLLYQNIGFATRGAAVRETFGEFETEDALEAGERVHHELFHPEYPARVARNATK